MALPCSIPTIAGAGYFELCGAALRTLTPDAALHAQAAVAGAAIPAPLLLPATQKGASAAIECCVLPSTGAVEIASAAASGSGRMVHVTATAVFVSQSAAGAAAGATAARLLQPLAAAVKAAVPAGRQPAAAVAALQTDTGRSGVWLDPAAFDCFLQLGQALKAVGDSEVYVPAGLGALRVAGSSSHGTWAATVPVPAAEGTACSNFHLARDGGRQEQVASIAALAAKSMGRLQAGPAASKAAAQRTDCLYEVAWQASEAAAAVEAGAAGAHALWRLRPAEQQQPATVAAGAIAAVQRLLAGAAGAAATGTVQLQTVGSALLPSTGVLGAASQDRSGRTAAAAALSGLIKTLNQEVPQLSWSSQDADGQAAGAHRTGAASIVHTTAGTAAADAFGSAARAGAVLAPLLLKSAAVEQTGPYHLFPQPRGSLNSLAALPIDAGRQLASNEVLVAVKAVGINFRCGARRSEQVLSWRRLGDACTAAVLLGVPTQLPCFPYPPTGTCSMCWACTPETPAHPAATVPVLCCAA